MCVHFVVVVVTMLGVCVCVCVCSFVRPLDWEGSWVIASRALAAVWTAVYLTGYSEPLLPPCRCHTSLGKV